MRGEFVEFADRLLVIGAGPVGLAMAKALRQHDIPYHHVDANDGLGGNWRKGVYEGVHIVSSKRSTAYSDYPMPADYPDFPDARQMLAYLEAYARDAGIDKTIECGRAVRAVKLLADESWAVELEDGERRRYKGVIVCNGHHWDRRWPSYPGTFDGQIMHAKDYRRPADLAGKRVLVIGGGNSGCDIACEAARVGASSDLSLRSGYWFLPKMVFGRPLSDLPIWSLPVGLQRLILRAVVKVTVGAYRRYGLPSPEHKLFERHPTYGTDVLGMLRQGRIRVRPDIERYDGRYVKFKDGSRAEYDLIVAATGYHMSFPFLAQGLVAVVNETAQVYAGAFPPGVKNLYIVGSGQPRNGFGNVITPAADFYARMILLQERFDYPLGDLFRWNWFQLPASNLVDPGRIRRQLWVGRNLTFLLHFDAWRYSRQQAANKRARALADARQASIPPAG